MVEKIAKGSVEVRADAEGVNADANKIETRLESLSKKLGSLPFKMVGFQAAFDGAKSLVSGLISHFAELGQGVDDIRNTAQNFGADIEGLQNIFNSAAISDVDRSSMIGAWEKMADKIGEAMAGGEEAIKVFDKLGISIGQLEGMTFDQKFLAVLDSINKLGSPEEQINALRDVFGKGGGILANLLGSDLEDRSKVALTEEELKNIDEFNDNIERLKQAFVKLTASLLSAVGPALGYFVENLSYLIDDVTSAFSSLLKWAVEWLQWLGVMDQTWTSGSGPAVANTGAGDFSGAKSAGGDFGPTPEELQKVFDDFINDLKQAITPLLQTPLMTLGEQLFNLQTALQFQLIGQQQFAGALGRLITDFAARGGAGVSPILPGVSLLGSQEAADSVLRSRFAGAGGGDMMARFVRAIEEQKKTTERQEKTGMDALTELKGINGILQVIGVQ